MIDINSSRCTGCGQCVNDCTTFVLGLSDGHATVQNKNCIGCGHCVAICPVGAVSFLPTEDNPYPMDEVLPYNPADFQLNPVTFLNSLKFRRSIRHFKQQAISHDIIEQIIQAGRYAPTAVNRQKNRFIVLEEEKDFFQAKAMRIFRAFAKAFAFVNGFLRLGIDAKKLARAKDDFLFKKAPAVILVVSSNDIDGTIAAANMERMANAMGLGVLHVGFFTAIARISPDIRRSLKLRFGQKIVSCLCIGYPAVRYQRTVPRIPARITWR